MMQLTKKRTHYLKTMGKMIPLIDFCHCCLETMWRQEGGSGLRKEGWDLVWEITVSYSFSCKPSHTLGHCELEGTGLISVAVSRTHLFTHQQQRRSSSEHLLYTATFPPFVAAVYHWIYLESYFYLKWLIGQVYFLYQDNVLSHNLCCYITWYWPPLVAQMVRNLPAMQETQVWFLGQEDPLRKGITTHPSFCLENSMDRKARQSTVHGVTKNQIQLSN